MSIELIIGQIEDHHTPQKHIPITPHCFIDRSNLIDKWREVTFRDPFVEKKFHKTSDEQTAKEALHYVKVMGDYLNEKLDVDHSFIYWKIMLYPWVLIALQSAWSHQEILKSYLNYYHRIEVTVKRGEKDWHFKDTNDFQSRIGKEVDYSEWLFSIIIEKMKPENVKVNYSNNKWENNRNTTSRMNFGKTYLTKIFNRIFSRFQKAYGMNILEVVFFNFLLFIKPSSKNYKIRKNHPHTGTHLEWEIDVFDYLKKTLPDIFLTIPKRKHFSIRQSRRVWHVSNRLAYDENVKHRVAIAAESGDLIVPSQHGGHAYGSALISEFIRKVELEQDAFISWGWDSRRENENIIPLPSPLTSILAGKHRNKTDKVIMVGTLAKLIPTKFDDIRPKNWLRYRDFKYELISKLNKDILQNLLYKPYHNERGALSERGFYLKHFPFIEMFEGDLHHEMLQSRAIVLDHPGTTLNLSFAANIPTLLCWPKDVFHFNEESDLYFNLFQEHGILCQTPETAADTLNEIEEYISNWHSPDFQKIRIDWVNKYARADKRWRKKWIKAFWNL